MASNPLLSLALVSELLDSGLAIILRYWRVYVGTDCGSGVKTHQIIYPWYSVYAHRQKRIKA